MSAAAAGRVGRFYTAARRHPWVLGKVADWKIPLGPYTPAQIAVAVGGGFLLVKTISWWSWMGPIPIAAWQLAIWAVRRPKIAGRAPLQAALGWVLLGWQPKGGRIGGRAARDRAPHPLLGGFTIEGTSSVDPAITPPRAAHRRTDPAPHPRPDAAGSSAPHGTEPATPVAAGPVSGVQQLIALAQQGGAR
ncbi:hypothetical protein ACQEV2_42215 [Streptomyces sp. CA-251387]|uniref:hypothetical protein n=1 Tax=Streptomyces sp. CA-251387 TaxID=3240064 RepID=UPI003D8A476E